jgi:DNA-binding NarL/FixJ family response regulator
MTAGSTQLITILVADDHEPTRRDVVELLQESGRFSVIGEASSAAAAVSLALKRRPRICLLDIGMPGGGVAAAWEISSRLPATRVVMFTVSDDRRDLFASIRAGASGYILKETTPDRMLQKLIDVHEGDCALSPKLVTTMLDAFRDTAPRRRALLGVGELERLTSREWQVLDLLRQGLTTNQVAAELSVTPATVRTHASAAAHKLRVHSRKELLSDVSELVPDGSMPAEER